MGQASEELLKNRYADLSSKPFFPGLIKYMGSGPVLAMVWEGLNAVKTGRVMLGATNPPTLLLEPSEVTSASRLVVTSATALTQLSLLTRRLVSGSRPPSSATGIAARRTGSTSRLSRRCCCFTHTGVL